MVHITIEVDSTNLTFIAGQSFTGKVHLEVTGKPLKCRGIRVLFFGEAFTQLHRGRASYNTTAPYFNFTVMTLWGNARDSPVLPVGHHSFPFSCYIPAWCPSSFEYQSPLFSFSPVKAHIKYVCQAVVDRVFGESATIEILVVGQNQSLLGFFDDAVHVTPTMKEETRVKTLGLCCCKSGQISATFRVPANCFRAGDKIPFYAEIENESFRNIKRIYICLKQTLTFWASCGISDTDHNTVCKVLLDLEKPIPPGASKMWQGLLPIPIEGVPVLGGPCSIISIQYKIVLTIVPKGPFFNLDLPMVIEMGTPVSVRLGDAE